MIIHATSTVKALTNQEYFLAYCYVTDLPPYRKNVESASRQHDRPGCTDVRERTGIQCMDARHVRWL